jgi:acetolactate synthase-1/2/3 large subunit
VPIVGDLKEVFAELLPLIKKDVTSGAAPDRAGWWEQVNRWRDTYPLGYDDPADGTLAPQYVIAQLGRIAGSDAVYVAGVGQHQMWAAQFISYEKPGTWINSGGLGTMGFSVPAAMGAKVGRPEATRLVDRRRRLLPDDEPGARHLRLGGHPDQGGRDQQWQPGHGPAVADALLRGAL